MQNKLTGSWGGYYHPEARIKAKVLQSGRVVRSPRTGQGEGSGLSDYLMENCSCWVEIQSGWPMGHSSLASVGCERWGWTTHLFLLAYSTRPTVYPTLSPALNFTAGNKTYLYP